MPWKALRDGEIVESFDVGKHDIEDLECPSCGSEMHLVQEHEQKDGAFIPRHFAHNPSETNRDCAAVGGGGESSIHEKRKYIALSKALVEFNCSDWGLEEPIGDRQADAYVEFSNGHPRYGVGLAIEYQHKNKDKDRKRVTQNYTDENYSTIWLWQDQYDGRDVDLLAGEVHTVWPGCVPEQSKWRDKGYREIKKKWTDAWVMGLSESGAPATLPPDWCDEQAKRIWEETPWKKILSRRDDVVSPNGEQTLWNSWHYIRNLRTNYGSVEVPATFMKDWVCPTPSEYWHDEPWSKRFQGQQQFLDHIEQTYGDGISETVPISCWIGQEGDDSPYHDEIKYAYSKGTAAEFDGITVPCENCGNVELHDPIHPGEVLRGSTCSNCGEWYTVYDEERGKELADG